MDDLDEMQLSFLVNSLKESCIGKEYEHVDSERRSAANAITDLVWTIRLMEDENIEVEEVENSDEKKRKLFFPLCGCFSIFLVKINLLLNFGLPLWAALIL